MANLPREKRRAEIIEAAIRLMTEGGLSSATVRGVADVLKASPGQIHHHFASADALRAEAFRELMRRALAESDAALATRDPLSRVVVLVSDGSPGAGSDAHHGLCRDATEAARMSEQLRAPIREAIDAWCGRISAALSDAKSAGQLPEGVNIGVLTETLVLIAAGADVMRQIGSSRPGLEEAIGAQIALHVSAAAPTKAMP